MILKNCRLIPELCEGFEEEMADIRIDGKKIAEILPSNGSYTGEEVVDMEGKTVLPGLFNCHEHLYFQRNNFTHLHTYTGFDHVVNSINYAHMLLSYGFTTVKDCGSIDDTAIKLRDAIQAGIIEGPNLLACGPSMAPDFPDESLLEIYSCCQGYPINSVADVLPAVRRQLSKGADFIKLCGTTRKSTVKRAEDALGQCLFKPEEVEAFSKEARRLGSYVTMHSTSVECHEMVIEAECHTLDHGIYLNQYNVDAIVKHGFKTNLVPTLAVSYVGYKQGWPTYDVCHPGAGNGMRMAHDAGVLIGFGTDDFQKDFKKMPAVEWIARSEFGISNIDLLKQATINSAKICFMDKKRGSIKVGKIADFAVIDGKPDEDLNVFNKPCAYVLKNGKIVSRDGVVMASEVKY